MTMQSFWLTPIDTLFFRDSQPFEQGSAQAGAVSLFPPPARTLIGAVRLALAQARGFRGSGSWSKEIAAVIGDGPHDMGKLRFVGPFLAMGSTPLYPMPLHVLGERSDDEAAFRPQTLLAPGTEILCDLGRARLPEPVHDHTRLDSGAGFFVTREGLEAVLAGDVPAEETTRSPDQLFAPEERIGLRRHEKLRTAESRHLYSATHVRLREGARIILQVQGVPDEWLCTLPRLIPLGGESRMAELELGDPLQPVAMPRKAIDGIISSRRLTVTLLTPLRLQPRTMPRPGEELAGMPGVRVIAACLGRPVRFGGWNSLRREPLPLRPYIPAGSTWFCTIEPGHEAAVCERHGSCIDEDAALGLGCIALGTWNEISNV